MKVIVHLLFAAHTRQNPALLRLSCGAMPQKACSVGRASCLMKRFMKRFMKRISKPCVEPPVLCRCTPDSPRRRQCSMLHEAIHETIHETNSVGPSARCTSPSREWHAVPARCALLPSGWRAQEFQHQLVERLRLVTRHRMPAAGRLVAWELPQPSPHEPLGLMQPETEVSDAVDRVPSSPESLAGPPMSAAWSEPGILP